MENLHFATLHSSYKEAWYVCVEHINAIRNYHDKYDDRENGVWIYLMGDSQPIKVTESIDEVIKIVCEASIE